ncbi:MAG TPA: AraC family transcriptional regulator [Puia sp.]
MKSIFQHHTSEADASFIVKEYCQRHFTSPFHFHDMYEIILIAKSYGKLYAGNKVMNFNENEVYLFGPGLAHCFYNDQSFIDKNEIAHAIVIFFREDFMGKDFFHRPELSRIKKLLHQSQHGIKVNDVDIALSAFFPRMTQEKAMPALILLFQLLELLSTQDKAAVSLINPSPRNANFTDSDSAKLEQVFNYVLENFSEEVNIKEASSLACLNEAAFCRYFKRRTEKTFSEFVNHVRITHATRLLQDKDWSIASICYECGYKNLSYFNRVFRDIMGNTPFEYRKSFNVSNLS